MSNDETIETKFTYIKANEKHSASKPVDYVFLSYDRKPEAAECEQVAQEYFETHNKMTLGEPLTVDLRPAFRKPLSEVTPKFFR